MSRNLNDLQARIESAVWNVGGEPSPPPWRRRLLRLLRMVLVLARDLAFGQLTLRAMSLVYTTLLSLVPLLALSFSVLKAFGAYQQMEPMLLNFLAPLGEKGSEITDLSKNFRTSRASTQFTFCRCRPTFSASSARCWCRPGRKGAVATARDCRPAEPRPWGSGVRPPLANGSRLRSERCLCRFFHSLVSERWHAVRDEFRAG